MRLLSSKLSTFVLCAILLSIVQNCIVLGNTRNILLISNDVATRRTRCIKDIKKYSFAKDKAVYRRTQNLKYLALDSILSGKFSD